MVYGIKQRLAAGISFAVVMVMFVLPDQALAYGIDDMVGDKWRVGTFLFLVFGMALYALFVVFYMRSARGKLKKGEYILLGCILGGVLLGFIVSFVQFVEGFLL